MPYASACERRSGPASMRIAPPASVWMTTEGRVRRSRGSSDRHVPHSQPIIGTPCEVPVPRKVICKRLRFDDAAFALLCLDEAHAQFVQQILDELRFRLAEVALRFLLHER